MALNTLFLAVCLLCSSLCFAEEKSFDVLLNETSSAVHHAQTHLDHMLNLPSHKDHQKVVDTVKEAVNHFAFELEHHSYQLHEKAGGKHNEALTQAANAAAEHFNNSASALKAVSGDDLKQYNAEYFKAAEVVLKEAENIHAAGPCAEIAPIVNGALKELKQDTDHYQDVVHSAVGEHAPAAGVDAGHHEHAQHEHGHDHTKDKGFPHHAHHNSHSSEESSEEKH